jgi:predicted transcriptional regulator
MTTLDRLYKKDLLVRRKLGRAYVYAPRYEPAELEVALARDAIDDLLRDDTRAQGPEPLLVGFVEAVGRRDSRMLEELERLVRREREAARHAARRGGAE